jgi:hypothetical protein
MSNPIKYSTGSESLALKKGNFYIGTGDVGKGPTSSTGYYNGITPPTGGYTIYLNKASGGPSIYTCANDTELVNLTNTIAGTSYATANECLVYFAGQTDKMVLNRNYEGIVTDGLLLNLDAGFTPSYPKNGTTMYDLIDGGNNGTLINGTSFDSGNGGALSLDGVNDGVNGPTGVTWFTNKSFTIESWFNFNPSPPSEQLWFSANLNGGSTQQDIHLRVVYGANLRFGFYSNDLDANGVVSNSNWYNVMCWYDYSTDNAKIYVNGSQVASSSAGPFIQSSANIGVGYWISRNTQYFKGNIAVTRVYDRALTSDEVLQNYNVQKGRFGL